MSLGSFTSSVMFMICVALMVTGVTSQPMWIPRFGMMPNPMLPIVPGMPVQSGFWPDSRNGFIGTVNNFPMQQQRWNTFAPLPMNRNVNSWMNNQLPSVPSIPAQNNGNNFGNNPNNVQNTNDPWEQFKLFSSGVNNFIGQKADGTSGASTNQISSSSVNGNVPWNSVSSSNMNKDTQFLPNGQFIGSGLNTNTQLLPNGQMFGSSGFVNPQIQPNFNNQFQNGGQFSNGPNQWSNQFGLGLPGKR